MHYVEVGEGPAVVFLHGIPTHAYLWRNVLPHVAEGGWRCIAVDHIGFGRSDKPDLNYSWLELARHFEGFVDALALPHVVLIGHDLGGAVALHWASRHERRLRGMAYLEAAVPPAYPRTSFASFGATEGLFRQLRDPVVGRRMLMDENFWIERFLPTAVMRTLGDQEMAAYRAPFNTVPSRKAIFDMVQSLPIEGQPAREWQAYEAMARWWKDSEVDKLVMFATPGRVGPRSAAQWAVANLRNVETAWVGYGIHFVQEDSPESIGRAIAEWLRRRVVG
jgi:haloalkane dehalogenase